MLNKFTDQDLDSFFEKLNSTNRERQLSEPNVDAVDLCSNDYLCLSKHPKLTHALHEGIYLYGAGSTASRLVRGHRAVFDALEKKMASWLNAPAALFFANGYAANVGTLSALCDASYECFIDRLAHASLVDGVRLSGAKKIYFRHNDRAHLEELLKKSKSPRKVIVTESIFSMDGDRAPMDTLETLAARHEALLYVDDAHAVGVCGDEGRGLASSAVDLRVITLGKALGLEGALVLANKKLRRFLLHQARTFVFSTAPLPAIVHAALTAVDLVREMQNERALIERYSQMLREKIASLGFSYGLSSTHIVPLLLENEKAALDRAEILEKKGFHVKAIRPPTVKESRLRFSLNAGLDGAQFGALLRALKD